MTATILRPKTKTTTIETVKIEGLHKDFRNLNFLIANNDLMVRNLTELIFEHKKDDFLAEQLENFRSVLNHQQDVLKEMQEYSHKVDVILLDHGISIDDKED